MKLRYQLLICCVVGLSAGYFVAPFLFPEEEIVADVSQDTDGEETDAGADADTDDGEGKTATKKKKRIRRIVRVHKKKQQEAVADAGTDDDFKDFEDAAEEADDDDADSDKPREFRRITVRNEEKKPVNETHYVGKLSTADWHHPKSLERVLAGKIRRKFKGTDEEKLRELLQDPETRLMLAQWELLHRANLDELEALMKDKDTAQDLTPLLNDLPWISSFVYDGELEKPAVALAIMRHLRQSDPDMDKFVKVDEALQEEAGAASIPGLKRRVAAAIAVEFTRQGWYGDGNGDLSEKELSNIKQLGYMAPTASRWEKRKAKGKKDTFHLARERYLFYKESIDQDLLNSTFCKQPDWLLHFICGWKGSSPFGTANTMRWLRDNCAAPPSAYTGMCSQVPYRPTNLFGDSIFTNYYYQPYEPLYPDNFAKMTRDVGAVCGGLSHFGASSANANGVPAITMGEPGHCAYAVYFDNKWHPANSIASEHHPHWSVWGTNEWSALEMYSAMYQDGAVTRDAQMLATLAEVLERVKNPINALRIFEIAICMQPLNKPIWERYIGTASRSLGRNPRRWLGVNNFVCRAMAPRHPQMCARFLQDKIYPAMLPALRTPKQRMAVFSDFYSSLKNNEEAKWDIAPLLDQQLGTIGKNNKQRRELYSMIIDSVGKHPEFGTAVTWVVKSAAKDHYSVMRAVLQEIDTAIATTDNKELLYGAVIRAAEEMEDGKLFNEYSAPYIAVAEDQETKDEGVKTRGSMVPKLKDAKSPLPKFDPLPGNLISAGGRVWLSSYKFNQGIIAHHAAALTEQGGHIQSDYGKHQKLVIELPKSQTIGGIVIVPQGSMSSYRVWTLEVSDDGKNWKRVADLPDNSNKPLLRLAWKGSYPRGKFIRIDSGEDQNVGINFKAVLVYDTKKKRG